MTKTIQLPQTKIDEINAILQMDTMHPDHKRDLSIDSFTMNFDNDYEIDITLYNGNRDSGPYIDAVLFQEGCEVDTLDVRDQIDGTYDFAEYGCCLVILPEPAHPGFNYTK